MPIPKHDRDNAMIEALSWAQNDNWIICFGRLFDDDCYDENPWLVWAYKGERRPNNIQEESICYVLPLGEVTKLS